MQNVTLVDPQLSVTALNQVSENIIEVGACVSCVDMLTRVQVTFTSNAVAAFTWLETTVAGHFSDNGLLVVPGMFTCRVVAST